MLKSQELLFYQIAARIAKWDLLDDFQDYKRHD